MKPTSILKRYAVLFTLLLSLNACEGGNGDQTAPQLVATLPAAGASVGSNLQFLSLQFDEPMDDAQASTTLTVKDSSDQALVGEWSSQGNSLVFLPLEGFEPSQTYVVEAADSTQLVDLAGNEFEGTLLFSFTTLAAEDLTAPEVVSTNPVYGTSQVDLMPMMEVVFNEAIDPATVDASDVRLENLETGSTQSVMVTVSGPSVHILPTAKLSFQAPYRLTLGNQIHDLAGNRPLDPTVVEFETGDKAWATPTAFASFPGVSSAGPTLVADAQKNTWMIYVKYDPTSTKRQLFGRYRAFGQADFASEVNISNAIQHVSDKYKVIGFTDGRVSVIYQTGTTGSYALVVRDYNPGTGWGPLSIIDLQPNLTTHFDYAMNAAGNKLVLWSPYAAAAPFVFNAKRFVNGAWDSSPTLLRSGAEPIFGAFAHLDAQGAAYVSMSYMPAGEPGVVRSHIRTTTGTTWTGGYVGADLMTKMKWYSSENGDLYKVKAEKAETTDSTANSISVEYMTIGLAGSFTGRGYQKLTHDPSRTVYLFEGAVNTSSDFQLIWGETDSADTTLYTQNYSRAENGAMRAGVPEYLDAILLFQDATLGVAVSPSGDVQVVVSQNGFYTHDLNVRYKKAGAQEWKSQYIRRDTVQSLYTPYFISSVLFDDESSMMSYKISVNTIEGAFSYETVFRD